MSIRYTDGNHNDAAGTRAAFAALSDDLEAAGLPPVTVVSGDRDPAEQVALFVARFWQQAVGVGRFADVRFWDGSGWGYGGGTRWVRWSSEGTVAVPGTGNHEKHRSNDLAWPYNSNTWQHARAREIAKRHNITCDGIGFGEWWHWTFWGALGALGAPASTGNATTVQEDDMYDDAAKRDAENRHAEVMAALEKVHRAAAPFKVLSWGTGLIAYNPQNGKFWILPAGYSDLLMALGLTGGTPFAANDDQLKFATGFLPNLIGLASDDRELSDADMSEIRALVEQSRVMVTAEQLAQLKAEVTQGAREGGEAGAAKALEKLTVVISTAA